MSEELLAMAGKTVSHYRVLEKLGKAGMGVVYKARDTHLDGFVAIKVLPPEKVADPERKRRFVQETKAVSALNHPNIITIYDIDIADGIDFIAVEYVAGKTLAEVIGRKGLKLNETLKLGDPDCGCAGGARNQYRSPRSEAGQRDGCGKRLHVARTGEGEEGRCACRPSGARNPSRSGRWWRRLRATWKR